MKSLEIVNEKLETGDIVTIVTKDYWLIAKEELQIIKQDLEVLEILRKQSRFEFNELSVEDYAKLKQWLEVNK